jgi:hypothetical protein
MQIRDVDRAAGLVFEAAEATVVHLRRVVGIVSSMLGQAAHEVADLALIYQDLANDLSGRDDSESTADLDEIRWTATQYRLEPSYINSRQQLN